MLASFLASLSKGVMASPQLQILDILFSLKRKQNPVCFACITVQAWFPYNKRYSTPAELPNSVEDSQVLAWRSPRIEKSNQAIDACLCVWGLRMGNPQVTSHNGFQYETRVIHTPMTQETLPWPINMPVYIIPHVHNSLQIQYYPHSSLMCTFINVEVS